MGGGERDTRRITKAQLIFIIERSLTLDVTLDMFFRHDQIGIQPTTGYVRYIPERC